ncbi:MAG: LysM peptidoglycan-binding domain-containing protein [Candidatus Eiseniibacteriota bacterium]
MKPMVKRFLILAPFLALAACSSSPPPPPSYDIEEGRYLTAEEYAKLSRDEATTYCEQLAAEIDIQKDNAAVASEEVASTQPQIGEVEARLAEAKAATAALSPEIEELERRLRPSKDRPESYTVRQDDWLWKIARSSVVYGDEKGWSRIFEANRDKIEDPNLIHPGMVLTIPR